MAKYTPSPLARNKPLTEVTLSDVLVEHARGINLKLNCHAIGQIQSFNSANQTCTVTIVYQKEIEKRNPDGTYSTKAQDYPILTTVPVIIMSGGTANLTFPIQKGDYCLVLFNDRDIDTWITSATTQPPNSNRMHSLSDGIALVGLKPFTQSISGYDSTRVKLQNDKAYVGVSSTLVKIANDVNTLKELLDATTGILKVLNDLNTYIVPTTGISPANKAAITAEIVSLNAKIGGLLE